MIKPAPDPNALPPSARAEQGAVRGFDAAILEHDQRLAELGLEIWVGGEPTFTDRYSESAEWLAEALGEQKLERALSLTRLLAGDGTAVVLRTVGRQYPGEDETRWSLGLYRHRDPRPIWTGPPDPMLLDSRVPAPDLATFSEALLNTLTDDELAAAGVDPSPDGIHRIVFTLDGTVPISNPEQAPELLRPSVHGRRIEPSDPDDMLVNHGQFLLLIRPEITRQGIVACAELPELSEVGAYLRLLDVVGRAAHRAGLPALILAGYPPPVNPSVMWTTVTPDPAVIEVNSAPYPKVGEFLAATLDIHRLAEQEGLSPFRLYYNGDVADSGGGGQITLGGPTPEDSPFIREPRLLTRLIRYCNHHPSLSYRFAHDHVGESGQSVRTDERGRDSFAELSVALELLQREQALDADTVWRALAPFLTDPTGNSHRAELNVEKLWNPNLPRRGCMGVVEFRALRMQTSPQRAGALAALLRAITARLLLRPFNDPLVDWADQLHDRFALPYYLDQDLLDVLEDLEASGVGLGRPIRDELMEDAWRRYGSFAFEGCRLTIRRALEFWPLVGDSASQDGGTSRLIDSSTGRIEIRLTGDPSEPGELMAWRLAADGWEVPLRAEDARAVPTRVLGLRYRRFAPWRGLHPTLAPRGPIPLLLWRPGLDRALRIELHEWRPDNEAYDGLPLDLDEARTRREQRLVVTPATPPEHPPPHPPSGATTAHCLDLRRL